ncbi:ATP-binding protein [Cesiribacter sp. SM1]|uniref:ATP-binding protein n=1 Tax=Cesiribacter sp. SM1 TaxID=2861196 RepID=UPI001CD23037|nr:ATP-binding protein [Cesiribacter sp. SM1]
MPQFRAKARAVDLLGKGQIADLPTAISELWKNGYDAYGDKLQAFLYLDGYVDSSEPVFVISDDGKGMTKEDITDKWFVLGTDSKSRGEIDIKGEDTLHKEPRIKMGEKGIGRLAVAYLGPQMLMLTKKKKHQLEAIFFDWRILENYNLFLEDIHIPNKTIVSGSTAANIFNDLKDEFLLNFPAINPGQRDPWSDQQDLRRTIISDCLDLSLPDFIIDNHINDLANDPLGSHATRFIIFQPEQQILDLKNFSKKDENQDKQDENSINHTVSALVGLFNLFKTDDPIYKTHFWIKDSENGEYDLLNFKEFFTPEDFHHSDHMIDGRFDEKGNFFGKVRIYKKEIEHNYKPIRKEKLTSFGPFEIKLGYVVGKKEETSLNDEQWRIFGEKLELYGGLYIYRDHFRVLPYGRAENDFLEFEERRNKSAGDNFFAKRRMFGYIEISRDLNKRLVDKSSREGFVNNLAYRDFKSELIAFFKDLAKKYFATSSEFDYKNQQKEEIRKMSEAESQEKERDKEARKQFSKNLKEYPQALDFLETHYVTLIKSLEEKTATSDVAFDEVRIILKELDECKIKAQAFKISKPARFAPTPLQEKNYYAYQKQLSKFQKTVEISDRVINSVQEKLKVQDLFVEFESKHKLFSNTLKNQFSEYDNRLKFINNKFIKELANEETIFLSDYEAKYQAIIPPKTDVDEIFLSLKLLESIFKDTREKVSNRIAPYLSHLERVNFDVKEDDLVGFYKMQFEEMKEEWNKTYELAQLGIAVEIIDHQFNTLYSQLSESIKSLKINLVNNNEALLRYNVLVNAFNHLEDNYKLLQPLYRTTGRIRKDVTGKELFNYIQDFFGTKLKENNIHFEITDKASDWSEFSYESVFKPVLINIINNAIYWLQPVEDKRILIDFQDQKLLILNSGLPIDEHLLENIFKLFYSDRPKGRGIGLYLAKKSLNGIGFNIYATNDRKYNILNGACFIIEAINK